jgi:hypothetical protein
MQKETKKPAAKPAANKPAAAATMQPRQVKRAEPVAPSAQTTAKLPQAAAPPVPVQRPKPLSTLMSTTALDGFSGFTDEVEGDDDHLQGGSDIQGTLLKFSNEAQWVTGKGDLVSRELELIVADISRRVKKWINDRVVQTIIVPPGEKFPDVKAMNEAAPRSEWRESFGKMVGPYQMAYHVYLLHSVALDKYTFVTSTTGGGICCRDIAEKVTWIRKYRGPSVNAVVTLSDTFMPTQWGGRQRPHFNVVRFVGFDGSAIAALPGPRPSLEGGAVVNEVEEPSLQEELDDDLPDSLK